jgi:hypothetical protein
MKVLWHTIPTIVRENLKQSLLARGNDFSSSSIAGFLKGSLGMNYRWDENKDMKKMIYNGIKRFYGDKNRVATDSQGIANIIYSFGEMKFKWADIPKDIKECLYNEIEKNYSRFESQHVSNIIYGYDGRCLSKFPLSSSYDSDLSKKNDQKAIWLLEMHRMFLQSLKDRLQTEEASLTRKIRQRCILRI